MKNNREEIIKFRCTSEEKEIIERAAHIEERNMSDFIRFNIIGDAKKILEQYGGFSYLKDFLNMPTMYKNLFEKYLEFIHNYPKIEKHMKDYAQENYKEFQKEADIQEQIYQHEYEQQRDEALEEIEYEDHLKYLKRMNALLMRNKES